MQRNGHHHVIRPDAIGFNVGTNGYDATLDTTRRRRVATKLYNEADFLIRRERAKLLSSTRDLQRNFAVFAWAVRKHLDYVSTFTLQFRHKDTALNADMEAFIEEQSLPQNFESRGLLSRVMFTRLMESHRSVDGDCGSLKLDRGLVQGIEGDRIAKPTGEVPRAVADRLKDFNDDGLLIRDNRIVEFCVCKRNRAKLDFEAIIPAEWLRLHGYFYRFDQWRGTSPLAAAVNTFRDCYEGLELALAKLKVSQYFALAIYREMGGEQLGAVNPAGSEGGEGEPSEEEAAQTKYDVDFGQGAVLLDLDPGDRAEFLDSSTPSMEAQSFTNLELALGLKALDIPFSFYDEAHTNYSGARQAWIQYEQSADWKRSDNKLFLDDWTQWKLGIGIARGQVTLPRSIKPEELDWEWIPTAVPWIDPLSEVQADLAAIDGGLETRTSVIRRRTARSFRDVLAELKVEKDEARAAGVVFSGVNENLVTQAIANRAAQPQQPKQPSGSK